jgi:glyoxylase-like metal-dependent hydrolase (beta-lactamase superfamily II)
VDTGLNRKECAEAMLLGLEEIGVDLNKTDFFITHMHADHVGLISDLVKDGTRVYSSEYDTNWFESNLQWDPIINFLRLNGFPDDELKVAFHSHPGYQYGPKWKPRFIFLKEGDILKIGEYQLRCVETPGHTKGHMCLYDVKNGIFLSGDHLLLDITSNIQSLSDDRDPLKEYLDSLDKVNQLDIEIVLPGHRSIFRNCRERIQELKDHHINRVNEVLYILREKSQTAFEVASQMHWDIIYDSWSMFPVMQKWFAVGEAIAHLKYLEEEGRVGREEIDLKRLYFTKETQ